MTTITTDKYGRNPEWLGRIVDISNNKARTETTMTLADASDPAGTTVIVIPYNGWYAVDATTENRTIAKNGKAAHSAMMAVTHLRAIRGTHAGRSGRIQRSMRSKYTSGIVHLLADDVWVHENDAVLMTTDEWNASRGVRHCAGCGKVLATGEGMYASLGLSCPDCFDELSDV